MTSPYLLRSATARRGEDAARRRLESLGYRTVATNYRTRYGEIDIIAVHRRQIVFVEVKTRKGTGFGYPEEAVTARKSGRVVAAARSYLAKIGRPGADWRVDVVAIELGQRGEILRLEVIPNAVSEPRPGR